MLDADVLPVDAWCVRETELQLEALATTESLFALSNGHIGLRGNLDEGEPFGLPGSYLNGFYEARPLPYAEAGYGYPESGQTIVNVTNGKLIRLLVDDEPFDLRYGVVKKHERTLDLRAGTLERVVEWESPARRNVRVRTTRVVSFSQRAVVGIRYEVEPLDGPARIIVQSELVANEQLPAQSGDPRVSSVLADPLVAEDCHVPDGKVGAVLVHRTRRSGLRMGAAMHHLIESSVPPLPERDPTGHGDAPASPPDDGASPPDDGASPPDDGASPPEGGASPPDDGDGGDGRDGPAPRMVGGAARGWRAETEIEDDWARTTVTCALEQGERLVVTKFIGYGWSGTRSVPALRDQVSGAVSGAVATGWQDLLDSQRAYLDEFWDAADVVVEGDAEVQQAVRFALFHVLQSGARAEQRAIPAKGLTGPGYDGHVFWDTEQFVLPVLTFLRPSAVRDALAWRHSTLDLARDRARQLHQAGAAFPWRTIAGEECSGYWPAGLAAMHVNADIAGAVLRYLAATGDADFACGQGLELLVEIARLLYSIGHHDAHGGFHIDGVTGPDEYSALADDNVWTNLMARRALIGAADLVVAHPDDAHRMHVGIEEVAGWRDAATAMHIPYDDERRVHQQNHGFTHYAEWDFEGTPASDYPLLLHRTYFDLYRKQVVKQADLVLAMHWCGDDFTPEDKARNVDYYERRTVRDSSLSPCTQAVMCAEVGHVQLAYDYLADAAMMDLRDLESNTGNGLHIASLAGAWLAVVAGLGGLRDFGGRLSFDPVLPQQVTGLEFNLRWLGAKLKVVIRDEEATYSVHDGADARLTICHAGEEFTVTTDAPVTRPLRPRTPLLDEPVQPAGRAPARRKRI